MRDYYRDDWNDADQQMVHPDEMQHAESVISELNEIIADQRDELVDLVHFIKRFNHPEEFGHLLDADAKQAVMKILSIYQEYAK